MLRLELIAHSAKADAYFVLAGRRKHLGDFLDSKAFVGQVRSKGKVQTILKMRPQPRIKITNPLPEREGLFQKVLAEYQNLSFPVEVSTTVGQMYPETCPTFQYQAYAWQIHFPPSMRRFYPRAHKFLPVTTSQQSPTNALVATLHPVPITEDRQGGSKNKDGRKVHPYIGPKIASHFPRSAGFAHTERNPPARLVSLSLVIREAAPASLSGVH